MTSVVTIIIPVRDSAEDLDCCLHAIRNSNGLQRYEIIVVDDESAVPVEDKADATIVRMSKRVGPGLARNRGVQAAEGEILIFVDADVVVSPDAIFNMVAQFDASPDVAAIFGSYDAFPEAQQLASVYRNLHHHFIHQQPDDTTTGFWAGFGGIRRSAFESVGGFSKKYSRPCIEDIELGNRLTANSLKIRKSPELQVTHRKRWTFVGTVRSDIFDRAIPWTKLLRQSTALPNSLNLRHAQRLSAAFALLFAVSPLAASALGMSAWPILAFVLTYLLIGLLDDGSKLPVLALLTKLLVAVSLLASVFATVNASAIIGCIMCVSFAAIVVLNIRFYRFLSKRGILFAAYSFPLHTLYFITASLTYVAVNIGEDWLAGGPPKDYVPSDSVETHN